MLWETIAALENEDDDGASGMSCEDPRFLKRIREGVCPLCDSPLDLAKEWLAALAIPCSSPICDFVLRPHGRLSRTSH
jgi:hypothetical protein